MNARPLLLILSPALFALGVAQQSAEPKAEEQFKNIQSFKGHPASELLPAMQFMAASLKVECSYCHVEGDFGSDAKDEKITARRMIAMQRDINDKNFKGRNQVTCATCHAGSPNPTNIPPTENLVFRLSSTKVTAPDKFYDGYATSTAVLPPNTMLHLHGTATDAKGQHPADFYLAADGRAKSVESDKQSQVLAFNGESAWYSKDGQTGPIPPQFTAQMQRMLWLPVGAPLPKVENPRIGGATMDGQKVMGVRGRSGAGNAILIFGNDHRVRQFSYFTPTTLGNLVEVYTFGDYHRVGNVWVPRSVDQTVEGQTTHFRFSQPKIEKEDASLFAMPGK